MNPFISAWLVENPFFFDFEGALFNFGFFIAIPLNDLRTELGYFAISINN